MREEQAANELALHIATPALMGQYLGKRLFGRPYKVYPWIQYLEQKVLYEIMQPGRKIIIVSVPPQNGKTTYFGLLLPVWYLGMNPSHQVIFISYNEPQASKWGLRSRDTFKRFGPELFGEGVHPSKESQLDWSLTNGFGGMMSAGILGGITGNPGHLIIADDLLKGDEDAGSAAVKAKIEGEVQNSVFSRFQEDTKLLVIATRWAEDDPSGRLIAMAQAEGYKGRPVEVINIKAIAEPTFDERQEMTEEDLENWRDFLGRAEGEGLKGQFSQSFYEEVRATVDSHGWYSLYQGEPTVREGGMFPIDRWGYYNSATLPDLVKKVRVWDMAASENKGDYSVGTLMGRGSDGNFYVLDRARFRKGADGVMQEVKDAAQRDGYEVTILIEQERAGAGKTVLTMYQREMVGYHVAEAKAEGSKESRATPYSNEQRKGNIYLPEGKPWLKEWRDEHVQMDGAGKTPRHDDQIDTGAYAFKFLTEGGLSEFWDPSMLGAADPDLDPEAQMELFAMRRLLTR